MRITLFGKKPPKKDAAASSVGLSCSKYGSSGATLFMANVMNIFVPSMLRCFFWLLRYPRIYGADIARTLGVRISDGSSPHTRGRVTFQADRGEFPGFIPVCAGQTNCCLMHPVIP